MDDLFVILLTVALIVVGSLSQIKKKRVTLPETKKQEPEFWETIFGDSEEPVVQMKTVPEFKSEAITETTVDGYRFGGPDEGKSYIYRKDFTQVPDETLKETDEIAGSDYLSEFSLRNAVIYTEILNKKYF